MRVLVTFAVEAEFAPWRKLGNLETCQVDGIEISQAQIGRANVDFVVTGMGRENARKTAEIVMSRRYTICISSGFAGALRPTYNVGDILAASAVQQLGESKIIECSQNLSVAAYENHAVRAKMFLMVDKPVTSAQEKERLSPFADAVDMESFAVLEIAEQKNIPAVAIRVISDRFGENLPADIDTTVDEFGRVKIGGVVKHIASHPLQLPALIRLGRHSRAAAQALANFLIAFIKELSFRSPRWPPPELSEIAAR